MSSSLRGDSDHCVHSSSSHYFTLVNAASTTRRTTTLTRRHDHSNSSSQRQRPREHVTHSTKSQSSAAVVALTFSKPSTTTSSTTTSSTTTSSTTTSSTTTTSLSNSDVLIIALSSTLGGICLFMTLFSVIVVSIYIYRKRRRKFDDGRDVTTPLLFTNQKNTQIVSHHQQQQEVYSCTTPSPSTDPMMNSFVNTTHTSSMNINVNINSTNINSTNINSTNINSTNINSNSTNINSININSTTTTTLTLKKKINLNAIKEGMIKSCIQDREGILIKSSIAKDLPRLVKKIILYFNHSELFSLLENDTIHVNSNQLKLDSKDVNDINMICCRFLADLSKCVNIASCCTTNTGAHEITTGGNHDLHSLSDEEILSSFSSNADSLLTMNGIGVDGGGDIGGGIHHGDDFGEDVSSAGGGGDQLIVRQYSTSLHQDHPPHTVVLNGNMTLVLDQPNHQQQHQEQHYDSDQQQPHQQPHPQQLLTQEEYYKMMTFQKRRKSTLMLIRALNHVRNRTCHAGEDVSSLALNILNFESFSIFLKETFGETSPVVNVLKLCSQTALFEGLNQIRPALLDLGIMFKDFRGRNWIVKIYTNSHHERPLIIHERIEQVINMQLQPLYTFTYQLQIEMDEEFENITQVNVKLLNIDFSKTILSEMEQKTHENKLKLVMEHCIP
ncbi:hypothetical protein FDP41_004507 [Naegleria fowleri]|uniref:Ras guanine nucleotide exchange factor glfB-like C-terminal domain-containing protein n=1 Tax=Naegleria fowleri TaxID=5763 RepID=A0A6A5BQW8_NAEFO|nr:uncharacterized protein FDP41_004507 [Naegleria fowleri]KAF0976608.1 hypothetical protein FDP41_004507 [Naegleria fowleri]